MKKLQTKMILLILLPTLLFFAGMGVFTSLSVNKIVTEDAEVMLDTHGELLADTLKLDLENPLIAVRTLSHSLEAILESSSVPRREDANAMLQQLLTNNSEFIGAWMFWEADAFDGKDTEYANTQGHDTTGRFIPVWTMDESGKFTVEPVRDYEPTGELFESLDSVLSTGNSVILEPFIYALNGEDILMTSIIAPVTVNGKTIGLTAVDISLDSLNERVNEFSFYDTGVVGLVSNSGYVIAHQHSELVGQNYFDSGTMADSKDIEQVKNAIQTGEKTRMEGFSGALEKDTYRLFNPIHIDGIEAPWSALLAVPINEVTQDANAITKTIIITSIVIILLLTIIILVVTKGITRVLSSAVEQGQEIANGNFTPSTSNKYAQRADELGDLTRIFITISDNMRNLIGRVKESAQLVAESANSVDMRTGESTHAANEVSSSIEKVAQSAETQMQSAGESAKAMEDMAQGVQVVSHAATVVSDTSHNMIEEANVGQKVVQHAVQQMDEIYKGTSETKAVIDQLSVGANEIQDIVAAITSISEQTNLLALNAAIEAARAGEYGKGFAVVADEVRKLADETNSSAANIEQLVGTIRADTIKAAESMDHNEKGVSEGIERMQNVQSSFQQIITSVEHIVKEATELSAVSEEMSAGSEEISATSEEMANSAEVSYEQTHQVAAASEQQLASMEEIAKSSETLKSLAEDLNNELRKFKV